MDQLVKNRFIEKIKTLNPKAIVLFEFDDAIIGVEQNTIGKWVLTYSLNKMIDELSYQGMIEDEALEFIDFNILRGFSGENVPIFRASEWYKKYLCYEQLIDCDYPQLTEICNEICLAPDDHIVCPCICHKQTQNEHKNMKKLQDYVMPQHAS